MDSNTELAAELKAMLAPDSTYTYKHAGMWLEAHGPAILTALTQHPADHIPDASNMVPAEQIADGALGVTLDWRVVAKSAGTNGIRYRTNTALLHFLAEIMPLAQQARAQALEEAAKVADRHEGKPCGHAEGWTDEQRQFYDAGQLDASTSIASAIRALQPHGQGGGE